jgi:hypothetical protein
VATAHGDGSTARRKVHGDGEAHGDGSSKVPADNSKPPANRTL